MATMNLADVTDVIVRTAPNYFADATKYEGFLYNRIAKTPASDPVGPRYFLKDSASEADGFAEGDTFQQPTKFTQQEFRLPPAYFVTTMEMTGHQRDALAKGNPQRIANFFDQQVMDHAQQLIRRVENALKGGIDPSGNGFVGIVEAIDDSNVYGGIDRALIEAHRSAIVDALGNPITAAGLEQLDELLRTEHEGEYTELWGSPSIVRDYMGLPADAFRADPRLVVNNGQTVQQQVTGIGDANVRTPSTYYRGRPVFEIPGYPQGRLDAIVNTPDNIRLEVFRPLTVSEPERRNDNMCWDMTLALQLVIRNCYKGSGALVNLV